MLLTPEQIASFKEDGYVVVPNLIDSNTLENWRDQIRSQIGDVSDQETAGDPEKHRKDLTVLKNFRFSPEESQLVNQPKVKAIIDQMGGGQFLGKDGNIRLLYVEPDKEWTRPSNGHIDGWHAKRDLPFLLGLATYLYDVEPHGGGTAFWPGSHIKSWRFLHKHPDHLEHTFIAHPEYLDMTKDIQPVELPAKAGDVIFWHCNILHEATHNLNPGTVRYGLFCRIPHKDQESFRDEIPDDLWKRWAI